MIWRTLRDNWMATLFAVVAVTTLVSYDIEIRSTFHIVFDVALFVALYVAMLRRSRRLSELEASSTRDEVLIELRKTVRFVLPVAAYVPVLALVERLIAGR